MTQYSALIDSDLGLDSRKKVLQDLGLNTVRLRQAYTAGDVTNDTIQRFADAGFKVLLNVDVSKSFLQSTFMKDTGAFSDYLGKTLDKYKSSIALLIVGNEPLNQNYFNYRRTTVDDYITLLKIAVRECESKGIAVTDGGMTSYQWYDIVNGIDPSEKDVLRHRENLARCYEYIEKVCATRVTYFNFHYYLNSGGEEQLIADITAAINSYNKKAITTETGVYVQDVLLLEKIISVYKQLGLDFVSWFSAVQGIRDSVLQDMSGGLNELGIKFKELIKAA